MARPGEFTERAFLHGKMDLAQAEAVRDLIESQTAFQAKVATEQMEGRLSLALRPIRDELVRIISHMETALEFVEDEVTPEAARSWSRLWKLWATGPRRFPPDFRIRPSRCMRARS